VGRKPLVAAIRIAAVLLASDNKLNFSRRGSLRMRLLIVEDDEKTASDADSSRG
jgi:hypothetical protein